MLEKDIKRNLRYFKNKNKNNNNIKLSEVDTQVLFIEPILYLSGYDIFDINLVKRTSRSRNEIFDIWIKKNEEEALLLIEIKAMNDNTMKNLFGEISNKLVFNINKVKGTIKNENNNYIGQIFCYCLDYAYYLKVKKGRFKIENFEEIIKQTEEEIKKVIRDKINGIIDKEKISLPKVLLTNGEYFLFFDFKNILTKWTEKSKPSENMKIEVEICDNGGEKIKICDDINNNTTDSIFEKQFQLKPNCSFQELYKYLCEISEK